MLTSFRILRDHLLRRLSDRRLEPPVGMLLVGFGIYMGAFVWWSGLNDRKDATCAVLGVVLLFSGAAIMSQVEVVKKALVEVGVMKSDGDRAKTD